MNMHPRARLSPGQIHGRCSSAQDQDCDVKGLRCLLELIIGRRSICGLIGGQAWEVLARLGCRVVGGVPISMVRAPAPARHS